MSNLELVHDLYNDLQRAIQSDHRLRQAQLHARLGKTHLARNHYREAGNHYQAAVEIFQVLGEDDRLVRGLLHLGVCLIMLDQAGAALSQLHRARDLTENFPLSTLQAALWGNLGLAHTQLGDYAKATQCHRRALEVGREIGDWQLQLQAHINLAEVYYQHGEYQQARETATVALDMARDLGDPGARIAALDLLGTISSRSGNLPAAVNYHQQAVDLAAESGDLHQQAVSLANKALALEGLTELNQAYPIMQQAHNIFHSLRSNYRKKSHKDLQRIKKALEND